MMLRGRGLLWSGLRLDFEISKLEKWDESVMDIILGGIDNGLIGSEIRGKAQGVGRVREMV